MQNCSKCRIDIRGNKSRCPLCGGLLSGQPERPAFPVIPRTRLSRSSIYRMSLFLFVLFEAAMVVLCYILGRVPAWIVLAMVAGGVGVLDVQLAMYYRNDVLRLVTWEMYVGAVLVLLVDLFNGFHRWSVSWALPCLFAALMIVTVSIGRGTGLSPEDYILYLLFNVIMSTAVQAVLCVSHVNTTPVPAVISIVFVIVFFLGMIIFNHRAFKRQTTRFFNI